jgi:uncharacterized membrane protein YqgA involved in biofilm formation
MTLSPVSAIAAMVAPVVLITAGALVGNGLQQTFVSVANRVYELNRERLEILAGPDGEVLTEDRLRPIERNRLAQIKHELPLVIQRIRHLRGAAVMFYAALGMLALAVVAIAIAVTAHSAAFGYIALALVLAGVVGEFAGVATMITALVKSANTVTYETVSTGELN